MERDIERAAVPLDAEHRARVAVGVAARARQQDLVELVPVGHGASVDRLDHVPDAQSRLGGGALDPGAVGKVHCLEDVADPGGGRLVVRGPAHLPDHAREREGEQDVEGGAREENEDLRHVADRRQLRHVGLGASLDRAQVGELRQDNVAPEREPRDLVLRAVGSTPGEQRRPEADRKPLDVRAPGAGDEVMAELVDEYRAAKKQGDQEDRPHIGKEGVEEVERHRSRNYLITSYLRISTSSVAHRRTSPSAARTAARSAGSKFAVRSRA